MRAPACAGARARPRAAQRARRRRSLCVRQAGHQTFVPTRRRADCARGLRATSAADGRIARRGVARIVGSEPQTQTGKSGGQVQPCSCVRRNCLTMPVLERVERDHGEPAAGPQHLERRRQRALERAELVVDLDPQRLEDALRRMALAEPRRRRDRRLDRPRRGRRCARTAARCGAGRSRARSGARSAPRRSAGRCRRARARPPR